jgi:hypothetical protein
MRSIFWGFRRDPLPPAIFHPPLVPSILSAFFQQHSERRQHRQPPRDQTPRTPRRPVKPCGGNFAEQVKKPKTLPSRTLLCIMQSGKFY